MFLPLFQCFDLSTRPPVYLPTMYMLKVVLSKLTMSRPVFLSTCLPADHVHVEIYIYKTFNVPTCLPIHLSTYRPGTCWKLVFTKLSMCRPVYLSTCLPVHQGHIKFNICVYNSFHVYMSTKDEFLFLNLILKSPSIFRYSCA